MRTISLSASSGRFVVKLVTNQSASGSLAMTKRATLVLAGGGHTHSLLLKKHQAKPLPDCRLILLSSVRHTPYSGMLPGVISGHYAPEEAFIDLKQLAEDSQCEFIESAVTGVDADRQVIVSKDGHEINYDFLSINTGSTQAPVLEAKNCLSIKPVNRFLGWLQQDLPDRVNGHSRFSLVVVGAGAAGVETIMALHRRLSNLPVELHLVSGQGVLPGYPESIKKMVTEELLNKGIKCHLNFRVNSIENEHIQSIENSLLEYQQLILATSASPSGWPAESSLTTDSKGFILVDEYLRSVSHRNVFAVGDIAAFSPAQLAKCGVYAVRQMPVLYQNLKNSLLDKTLVPYHPQQRFLALLSCADGRGIASRGWFRARGRMVWHWKDSIDRRFMAQFPRPESGFMRY